MKAKEKKLIENRIEPTITHDAYVALSPSPAPPLSDQLISMPPSPLPRGRPYGTRLPCNITIDDEQNQLFSAYLEHLSHGLSAQTFAWRGHHTSGTHHAAEALVKHHPDRFKKLDIEIAKTLGYAAWEQLLIASATGDNTRANVATLQMIMRNKYNWDRQGITNNDMIESEINRLTTFFLSIGLSKRAQVIDQLAEHNHSELSVQP